MSAVCLLVLLSLAALVLAGVATLYGMARDSERELEELKKRIR